MEKGVGRFGWLDRLTKEMKGGGRGFWFRAGH
jgi:hypothetical protein